jgi:hypothetical protein
MIIIEKGLGFLLHLFNLSFCFNYIPDEWKVAKITMIEKKARDSHNINNYRQISLTNFIVKLKEKLLKGRLVNYLEKKNLFIDNQAGFRKTRRTIDILFYFKEKCLEAFDRAEKDCGIISTSTKN